MNELNSFSSSAQTLSLPESLECQIKHIPLKRAFDIFFSLTLFLLLLPLFIMISIAIWSTSKGKIVYAHKRIGRGGKSFYCYKFRTMYPDADIRLKDLLESNQELRKEWEHKHKLTNDPRVTPVGAFLRKYSLDEFPQLWNVFKGDMSVVGPRPIVQEEVIKYSGNWSKIFSIRPGLTCIWQVSGRSDTSYQKRVALDEEYVDNHSLLLDLKLIAKTIPSMISSKGAY